MIRRHGDPVRHDKKYTLRAGVYAILPLGNDVLLTHQARPVPEFQLPGGGIDAGESSLAALHREVFEETGWRIAAPRRLGAFRRFTFMPEYDIWAEKLCHVYLARPVRRIMPPTEPGHSALWAPAPVAIEIIGNDGDRAFLRDYFSRF
ncbi:NUDIX domain-containing protein [Sinisalibacter lacisalsi]|uniref:NUDIX hydrolase n=1 Tax=Sinisalibacter lacisalsi TaxID=1526570 RepID=A0ABQ1QCI8_9RHOB|nr:NUDIX hydrolase [Sinisalibacter lacisalsi]GGD21374.1 NUDIX hydrolase [Sinisalibacter lacisalsi]